MTNGRREEGDILYEFVFVDENGAEEQIDVWANYETEAWRKADDIAYEDGYVDYRLAE